MLGFLKRLLFKQPEPAAKPPTSQPSSEPHWSERDLSGREEYDAVATYKALGIKRQVFLATLQLRNKAAVLRHHGEVIGIDDPQPGYAEKGWEGMWSPCFDEDAFPMGGMASDIGQLRNEMWDYQRFLVAFRTIYEDPMTLDGKIECMRRLAEAFGADGHSFGAFMDRHGGADALIDRFLPRITALLPVNKNVQAALEANGFLTVYQIDSASDAELKAIRGLGPKALQAIRRYIEATDIPWMAERVEADPEYRLPG